MKIKTLLLATVLLAAGAQAQQINPITKAMLDGYDKILSEDPKDYVTLYQRAAQYYQLSQYDRAYTDIVKALQYTPEKDTDMLTHELSLMADVAIQVKDYQKALDAIDNALKIDPDNYANIYKRGNICLYLNLPDEAYRSFKSMQRLKSRSQEAYFGMAKAAIMRGDNNDAMTLMKEAENADPSNYITYCRIGDLYNDMGQTENAATNYIMAFSLASNPQRPLESLVALSNKDFDGVATALDYAVTKTNNRVPLYFLKGNLAYHCGRYSDADAALQSLLRLKEGQEPGVYAMFANTQLALGNPEEAIANIDKAIAAGKDESSYEVTRSQALLQNGHSASALIAAKKALEMDDMSVDAMLAAAKAALAQADGKTAVEYLNEAVMTAPDNPEPLMLRAYAYGQLLNLGKQSVSDYTRVAQSEALDFPAIAWKALASARTGKKLDADAIIEEGLKTHSDKNACYYAALYYAQTGSLEKAKEMVDRAKALGYQNQYNLRTNTEADLNIAPVRYLLAN